MMWNEWGMGWGFFGTLHMLLWWVLIVLGIVVLVKWLIGGSSRTEMSEADRALQILRERYARGEVDKEEFEQRKRDLSA